MVLYVGKCASVLFFAQLNQLDDGWHLLYLCERNRKLPFFKHARLRSRRLGTASQGSKLSDKCWSGAVNTYRSTFPTILNPFSSYPSSCQFKCFCCALQAWSWALLAQSRRPLDLGFRDPCNHHTDFKSRLYGSYCGENNVWWVRNALKAFHDAAWCYFSLPCDWEQLAFWTTIFLAFSAGRLSVLVRFHECVSRTVLGNLSLLQPNRCQAETFHSRNKVIFQKFSKFFETFQS